MGRPRRLDRRPHGLAALADGYRGHLAKPWLGPIALKATPWGQPDLEPPPAVPAPGGAA